MSKEFAQNVKGLFCQVVTTQTKDGGHTSADLLETLRRKVTQPQKATFGDHALSLVYDNVSLDVENDLSSMKVWFTGDYVTVLDGLQGYDLFQLSEFVLALERDIPQWRYIWVADDKLQKEKTRIAVQMKNSLRDIKRNFRDSKDTKSFDTDACRIRFYNLKAKELMLEHDNPFWENRKSEAEILDECNVFHIVPPIESWYEEWAAFMEECEKARSELERQREEHRNKLMKMRHLISLKQMKLEALIRTIEFHPSVSFELSNYFEPYKLETIKFGYYCLTLVIDNAAVDIALRYGVVDQCADGVIGYIKRINDLSPELRDLLADNGPSYFLASKYERHTPYHIRYRKGRNTFRSEKLSSSHVINQLNQLVEEMRAYIKKSEDASA